MASDDEVWSGERTDPEKSKLVRELYECARSLKHRGLRSDALEAYDRVLALVPDDKVAHSQWCAAASLSAKAELLTALGREHDALELVTSLRQYTQDPDSSTREHAWYGLQEILTALSISERWGEQLSLLETVIEDLDRSAEPDRYASIGRALMARAATLEMLDREDEADLVRLSAIGRSNEMLAAIDRHFAEDATTAVCSSAGGSRLYCSARR